MVNFSAKPSEFGLYYLNSRYYDPAMCRFINADGYVSTGQGNAGLNMYSYCGNNPVNRIDSNGRFFEKIGQCLKKAYTTKGNVKKVVYGQDSCMVIYSKGNATNNYYFVPKDGDGYKIPDRFAEKTVYKNLDTTGIIYVYNVRGTKDYYVSVFAYRKGTKLDILDMNGNQIDVEMDELFVDSDTMAGRAYFLAEGYSDGYFITINEERIYIS